MIQPSQPSPAKASILSTKSSYRMPVVPALSTQHSTLSARCSALNAWQSTLSIPQSALGTRRSALSTRHSALSTQHSALRTQNPRHNTQHFAHGTRHSTLRPTVNRQPWLPLGMTLQAEETINIISRTLQIRFLLVYSKIHTKRYE